ncbi:MAG: hypothetical protein JXB20_03875 [Bacilli bacterium]|nr:hypothetical protein [Bacilli bacterium]MBN2696307.1 hypothetical protein [Bacilli bacterium]
MVRKRLILSLASLFFSLAVFAFSTYAWFAISSSVSNSPIGLEVDSGFITDAEIRFFTLDDVFKYDDTVNSIKSWDGDSWETPIYSYPEDIGYAFEGIILKQYDSFIEIYNDYNSVYVELYLQYEVEEDTPVLIELVSDTSLATSALTAFGVSSEDAVYFSEVVQVQTLVDKTGTYAFDTYETSPGVLRTDSYDMFDTLRVLFDDEVTYPIKTFYGLTDTYSGSLNLATTTLYAADSPGEMYLYFNLAYYADKVELLENGSGYTRFFQDIVITIIENGGA